MKNMLKIELMKALKNKYFITCLVLATLIACLSAAYTIDFYFEELADTARGNAMFPDSMEEPALALGTLYRYRLGVEGMSLAGSVFYFLVPFFTALAYGWSYLLESKSGYVKNVITRTSRFNYYFPKYVAVFLSGGLTILIPLIINAVIIAMFVPAITPDILYDMYYGGLSALNMWSSLFYTTPFLHMLLYMLFSFVVGGMIASMSYAVSFFIRNRFAVILFPTLFFMGVGYLEGLRSLTGKPNPELSLPKFLIVNNTYNIWQVVLIICLILFIVPAAIIAYKGGRDDVF